MEQLVQTLIIILKIIEGVAIVYFCYTVTYSLFFSIGAFFYRSTKNNRGSDFANIVVLIPAYKEDVVIIETAKKAINHNYPKAHFDVIVIADSLKQKTLDQLFQIDRLKTVTVQFEKSTKVKALNAVLNSLEKSYDLGVILDADNIMQEDFLVHTSNTYLSGMKAIQGQRVAKNKNTSMAVLDGLSEAINNRIYRQGTTAFGFSCSFIGSGMAIDYALLKSTLNEMSSVGGFDRDMEVRLIGKGHKVHYIKEAIVLDEKVDSASVFKNQRKRWIYSQYHYLWSELRPGFKRLFKGDIVYFNSAVLRNIQLPRLINIGLLFLITVVTGFFPGASNYSYLVWGGLLGVLVLSNVLAIPRRFFNKELLRAIVYLPKVFIIMISLLFKLKGANKKFIHTPHTSSEK